MVRPIKVALSVFCLFILLFGLGAFISPYVKLDEQSKRHKKCRLEIALIRDFLRNTNLHMEVDFLCWRTNVCADVDMSTAEQMGCYCWIVCKKTGSTFLNFRTRDGYTLLTDPWGCEYNIAETNKLPVLKQCESLRSWNVGPFIIWSSGMNRKNEYGAGDDIMGMRK